MYAQQATWDDVPRPVRWMIRIVLVALIVGLGIRAYEADATPMPALNDTEFTIQVTPA